MAFLIPGAFLLLLLYYPLVFRLNLIIGSKGGGFLKLFWYPLGYKVGLKITVYRKKLIFKGKTKPSKINRAIIKNIAPNMDILEALKIKKLMIKIELGLGDAAFTCLGAGAVNIFLGIIFPLLDNKYKCFKTRPKWQVRPVFGEQELSFWFEGVFSGFLMEIIIKAAAVSIKARRDKIGGRKRNKIADGNSFGKP